MSGVKCMKGFLFVYFKPLSVLDQEQFQCVNVSVACLEKLCVTYVGWNYEEGSKGRVGKGQSLHCAR